MISRKNFIKQASLLSTVLLVSPGCMTKPTTSSKKIGLQLYSLREQIVKDVEGVIEKVAKAGYQEVETYGYNATDRFWGLNPVDFNSLLKANNLVSPSGHYDLGAFLSKETSEDDLKRTLDEYTEAALAIDQQYLIVPWLAPEMRASIDDYKYIAEKINRVGEELRKSNLQLGYHNHDFEFEDYNGQNGYDILLTETDKENVIMELDLYWVVRSEKDPVKLFNDHPNRFTLWHVKDMDKLNPDLNTEVGNGSIDFKTIFQNAKLSGLKYLYVEQENFAIDPYVSIKTSVDYIKNSLLKGDLRYL
jgi:sugar phosphate isomerase/epimerase